LLLQALGAQLLFPCVRAAAPTQDGANTVHLGDTAVELATTHFRGNGTRLTGPTFVSVHENEQTAVKAVRRLLARRHGRLIELRARRTRLVTFELEGARYIFDPNRIYTDAGIEKTLRRYGPYRPAAHDLIAQLREALLALLRGQTLPLLIALHNNGGGDYSIRSYQRGGEYAANAADIAINRTHYGGDLLLVTDRAAFEFLRDARFNVVLQSSRPVDDGSLSVYCQQHGVPYINVEARHGHLSEQSLMLEAAWAFVDRTAAFLDLAPNA
jgi:hypothetical protein